MNKIIFFLFFCLNISLLAYSQDYGLLKFKIYDTNTDKPILFAKVCLLNKDTIQCVASDFDGYFSFIVNMQKIDSAYLEIKIEQEKNKVFINEMPVLYHYKLSYFAIALYKFERFTQEEYKKYLKENRGIPKRKKTLAKDVK